MCKNCKCKSKVLSGHYLLKIVGDVEPSLSEPFPTPWERDDAAKKHRSKDIEKEDGLYRLDMIDGIPVVSSFSGGELDTEGSNEDAT